ncbi:MAG: tRNA pseudouridine(55) synthase TruB [Chloroflexota bacterium]
MKGRHPSGILNVNKPLGKSSHHVVEVIREATGIRRVGHAGTLDPLATGVLVVCVGRNATRVAEYLMDEPKTYRTDAKLGVTTDTFDAEGTVVTRADVDGDQDDLEEALDEFRGRIEQMPPMYSALKHQGKPLYQLARQGIEVEREPRPVEIFRLDLIAWRRTDHRAWCRLEIECSPGTYIRTLVHDLGQRLGCGAHVTSLTRLASGHFRLEDAVTLDRFFQAAEKEQWVQLLSPVDKALAHRFPALHLDAYAARKLCSGQSIRGPGLSAEDPPLARVYGPEGRFLALAAYDDRDRAWRPRKVFVSSYPGASGAHAD